MTHPLRIAAVVPVYQEPLAIERLIKDFIERIFPHFITTELFVFEDGSTDSTKKILERYQNSGIPRLHISTSDKRKGYPVAVRDALLSIDPAVYSYVLFFDGDGQYYIEDIQEFIRLAEGGSNEDIIVGQRTQRAEPVYRRLLTRGLRSIENVLFAPPIKDITSALRLMKTAVARDIASKVAYSKSNFWLEFTARMSTRDLVVREIPVRYKQREQGTSQVYTPRKILKIVPNELYALIRVFVDVRGMQALTFAFVGASGALVILFLTWLLTERVGLFYLLSATLAIEVSILWAFALNTKITFRYTFNKPQNLLFSLASYQFVALGGYVINLALLYALTTFFNVYYLISELLAIIVAFGFNYLMSIRFVWITKKR